MRTLVLGIGNPILSDDGVGIHVARALKARGIAGVDVDELAASGLELLDLVRGYERVIIIDAIQTVNGRPGEVYELEEKDFEKAIHGSSPHGINIATALALGRRLAPEEMPKEVAFFAVEAEDVENVREELTPAVREALPRVVEMVEARLGPGRRR